MKLLELVAGPDTDRRGARARRGASARTCSARASWSARTRRTSSATASACTRMMTHDPPDARATGSRPRTSTPSPARRWRTRRARASAPPTSSASTPSSTSPTTATSRSSTTRSATCSRCPPTSARWSRRSILGDKTKGGFYKKAGKDELRRSIRRPLEYRAKGGDEAIKQGHARPRARSRTRRERVKKLVADQGKAGAFAWKVLSRALAYSARRIGEIADERRGHR